jgi:hypothetical protein
MFNPVEYESSAREIMPDLRIVPITSLVPHEAHDVQRSEPLTQRILGSGVWLNPPVVAPMDDERFVILDGANRHHALYTLGYPCILVQVVDYEGGDVQLETWHHVIGDISWFEFLRHLNSVPSLKLARTDLLSARAVLARREALAYAVMDENTGYILDADAQSMSERTLVLNRIVDTYKERGTLNRINTDSLRVARRLYKNAVAIVVFPHYEPAEILVAARDGVHLPPGITRHIIRGRAMRLNYPLEALRENGDSLEAKNARLQAWIQERSGAKRIRYYAEPTFLFDE